ncbi:hypothetical protein Tco_0508774, partial [Tanacetum coccineum]
KDSERLKPLDDWDSSTHPLTALSGTNIEYKDFSEVELDSEPLKLTTMDYIQALLIDYVDELIKASNDDVFEGEEEMDEDIQEHEPEETQSHHYTKTPTEEPHSQEHQSPSPPKEQPESSKDKVTNASDSGSSCFTEDHWEKHEEVAAFYADLKATVEGYYEENVDHRDQTDKLIKKTVSLKISSQTRKLVSRFRTSLRGSLLASKY